MEITLNLARRYHKSRLTQSGHFTLLSPVSPYPSPSREGMIKDWTQNNLFHDPRDVIISSQMAVSKIYLTVAVNKNLGTSLFFKLNPGHILNNNAFPCSPSCRQLLQLVVVLPFPQTDMRSQLHHSTQRQHELALHCTPPTNSPTPTHMRI